PVEQGDTNPAPARPRPRATQAREPAPDDDDVFVLTFGVHDCCLSTLPGILDADSGATRLIRLFREHHLAAEDVIHRGRTGQDDGYSDDRHEKHETQRFSRRGAVVTVQL